MINVIRHGENHLALYYNKDNEVQRIITKALVILPKTRAKNNEYVKKVKDIYTKKEYFIEYTPIKHYNFELTIPYKINKTKEGFPTYDYMLATKLRYFNHIIDLDIDFPKYLYYDIETTSLDPKDGILTSVVFIDAKNNVESFINDSSEKEMLLEISKYLKDNNIMSLIGFNNKSFDDEYLAYRMKVNGIRYNPIMNCNIDIMRMCNKLFISGSLASIAKQLGVIEKIELESNPIKLFYDGDLDTLLKYNIRDVQVTKAISEKMNILPFCKALWELSWCDFRNLNANSILVNSYINKRLWEDDLMVSKADLDYKGNFGGGFNYIHI